MIIKLILNQLELDLSNYEFTFIEENNWLKDNTISKFTFPVEIKLTTEQDAALGNISEQNLTTYNTLQESTFYVFGESHEAVFEIQSILGRTLVGQIRYGLEEFPNFNKRLSELPLESFDLSESIYTHAESIISQTWPNVNYNFPQVISDAFDLDSEQWQYFEGIINKYVDGDFIINEFDSQANEQINRNVMLPMAYMLYVLQVGFADAGLTLSGEILDDTYYKKATIFALNDFYTKFTTQSSVHSVNTDQYIGNLSGNDGIYNLNISLPEPGRYKIAGNVVVRVNGNDLANVREAKFKYNNSTKWSGAVAAAFYIYKEEFYTIDFNIDYTGTEGDVLFSSEQLHYSRVNGQNNYEALLMDITLTQLAKFDVSGNLITTLVEPTAIDLSKSMPDMSFGEFVFAVIKKRNYGYDINENTISINKKNISTIDASEAVDLSGFEVFTPKRNFNKGKSYVFKQFDYEHEDYKSQKILINNEGYQVNNFVKSDDTQDIVVNSIALPLKTFGVTTAHGFLDDFSKLQLVLFSGLSNGLNLAEDPEPISHLNNYLADYADWFNFLLSSININWVFDASHEELSDLKIRSIIYAYRQFHVISKLSRKTYISQSKDILLEVEIDTETLP